jgi:retron-type reverse transcriptase
LKLILKAGGKRCVPQGGVISPLLSNIYLNEVDKMLERAKEVKPPDHARKARQQNQSKKSLFFIP